ncbi:hypothetical protein AWW67_10810 [Roseivirga seohaensis]|uniref:Uncharacterized protein n=1 Tax=Roseivirga seohaensis TaxID=1914963 RepID=A0A150XM25_9BACT|nr:hypothetical protein AWW67_10810 [Roseivirga seohaensis]
MNTRKHSILSIIIYVLITFLFSYHSFKLYIIHFGEDFMNSESFINSFSSVFNAKIAVIAQSVFRVIILISLILIVKSKKME